MELHARAVRVAHTARFTGSGDPVEVTFLRSVGLGSGGCGPLRRVRLDVGRCHGAQAEDRARRNGIDHTAWTEVREPGAKTEDVRRTMTLFAHEVLPVLRTEPARVEADRPASATQAPSVSV